MKRKRGEGNAGSPSDGAESADATNPPETGESKRTKCIDDPNQYDEWIAIPDDVLQAMRDSETPINVLYNHVYCVAIREEGMWDTMTLWILHPHNAHGNWVVLEADDHGIYMNTENAALALADIRKHAFGFVTLGIHKSTCEHPLNVATSWSGLSSLTVRVGGISDVFVADYEALQRLVEAHVIPALARLVMEYYPNFGAFVNCIDERLVGEDLDPLFACDQCQSMGRKQRRPRDNTDKHPRRQ